jgi:hypothetical protein
MEQLGIPDLDVHLTLPFPTGLIEVTVTDDSLVDALVYSLAQRALKFKSETIFMSEGPHSAVLDYPSLLRQSRDSNMIGVVEHVVDGKRLHEYLEIYIEFGFAGSLILYDFNLSALQLEQHTDKLSQYSRYYQIFLIQKIGENGKIAGNGGLSFYAQRRIQLSIIQSERIYPDRFGHHG